MTDLGSESKFSLIFSPKVFLMICTTMECERVGLGSTRAWDEGTSNGQARRELFPQLECSSWTWIFMRLAPSCHSGVSSSVTSSEKPSLSTLPKIAFQSLSIASRSYFLPSSYQSGDFLFSYYCQSHLMQNKSYRLCSTNLPCTKQSSKSFTHSKSFNFIVFILQKILRQDKFSNLSKSPPSVSSALTHCKNISSSAIKTQLNS